MATSESVMEKLRNGESEEQVLSYLDSLSWNEIRAMKAKLVSETGAQSSDGGRTKAELHKTIVKLCQEILASANGVSVKKQKVDDAVASKSPTDVGKLVAVKGSTNSVSGGSSSNGEKMPMFASADQAMDTESSRPLPPNVKPVPTLQELGLARSSFAFGVASNDFSCSVFDLCQVAPGGKRASSDAELAALGKALLLNTRLRRIIIPFVDLSERDWNLLFGPCIEYGHSLGLTVLDLRCNNAGKALAPNLGTLVGLCPNLQTLLVDGNDLKEAGFLAVVKALPPSIQNLSLSSCSDKVVSAIAAEMEQAKLPNLLSLCLRNGSITDASVMRICSAVSAVGSSCRLSRLDLRGNSGVSSKAGPLLTAAMRAAASLWWVQCDESLTPILQETAKEKFKIVFKALHPAVVLQQTLQHDHQHAAVTPHRTLEAICACVSVGVDISALQAETEISPVQSAASFFGDGRVMQLLLAGAGAQAAASRLDSAGRSWLGIVPWMSPENLRVLLECGMPALPPSVPVPSLVALATYAWSKGRGADDRGWLYRFRLALTGVSKEAVNMADADGETALSVLARSSYADVVELLLLNGANPECRDKALANTPLHWACKYGHCATVRLLLRYCDVLAKNAAGETPLDLARKNACAQVELELMVHLRNKK